MRCSDAQDNFNVSDVKSSIKMNGTHLFPSLLEMTRKSQCFVFFKKKSGFFFRCCLYFYTSRSSYTSRLWRLRRLMLLDDFSVSHDGIKAAIKVERLGAYIHLSYFSYFAMFTKKYVFAWHDLWHINFPRFLKDHQWSSSIPLHLLRAYNPESRSICM